jgi:hypothetical protein
VVETEAVSLIERELDGWADGDVGPHGGVEAQQRVFGCRFEAGGVVDDAAVEDGPAVFTLAKLQEGRVFGGARRAPGRRAAGGR